MTLLALPTYNYKNMLEILYTFCIKRSFGPRVLEDNCACICLDLYSQPDVTTCMYLYMHGCMVAIRAL